MSTLTDLNERLFDQLNRLDTIKKPEDFALERERSKILIGISKSIIENKRLMLDITKHADECNLPPKELPESLRLELRV